MSQTKILIIEDDEIIREVIQETLTVNGFLAIAANSGQEGLEQVATHQPDLIICDVMMPNLDGYGVLKQLKQGQYAQIPFIFLTAKTTKEDVRHGMNLGADDYLTKPFSEEELITAIRSRLQKKQRESDYYHREVQQLRETIAKYLPHELKTPLVGIVGTSSFLISAVDTLDRQVLVEFLEEIQRSGERLNSLIQRFLYYLRYERILADLSTYLQGAYLVSICANLCIEEYARHNVQQYQRMDDLAVDLAEVNLKIPGQDLELLIKELTQNACYFSPPGSPIVITGTLINPEYYQVEITDQGRGMTPEAIANVGPYCQFERDEYEQQGIGLGLAIAQLIVKIHQGEFQIFSQVNQGTTIQFTLPVAPQNADSFELPLA